jgi:hypothetical protein
MIAVFVVGWGDIAKFEVRGETGDSSFEFEAGLKVSGGYGYSFSGQSGSGGGDDRLRVELALERAEDIRSELGAMFGFWVLIGALFSGRPRTGPRVGAAASIFTLVAVFGAQETIESSLKLTDWPLPVSTHLEFTWVYWVLLGLTSIAFALNVVRWILEGRGPKRGELPAT